MLKNAKIEGESHEALQNGTVQAESIMETTNVQMSDDGDPSLYDHCNLTELVELDSPEYRKVVTEFLIVQHHKKILADNAGINFLSVERILEGLKRHALLGDSPDSDPGIPQITTDDISRVVGFGGWELPWVANPPGLAYDLNYVNATPLQRAAVQVFLFRIDQGCFKTA